VRTTGAVATLALTAACWMVWEHAPDALAILGLGDLDIPGRVAALFLFLSVIEALLGWLRRSGNEATAQTNQS
jgi:hypothetical protein